MERMGTDARNFAHAMQIIQHLVTTSAVNVFATRGIQRRTAQHVRETERDLTQFYDKTPTPTEKKFKLQRDNTKNATKTFDDTTIADRLRTVMT